MSSYVEAIEEAQKNLRVMLFDTDQGNLTFVGDGYFPDLNVNSPRDLFMLRAGTVLSINGNPWMLIENCDAARKWNTYWMSCDGVAMNCDDFYVHAVQHANSLIYCHEAI